MILIVDTRYFGLTDDGRIGVESVAMVNEDKVDDYIRSMVKNKAHNGYATHVSLSGYECELAKIEWWRGNERGIITARDLGRVRI